MVTRTGPAVTTTDASAPAAPDGFVTHDVTESSAAARGLRPLHDRPRPRRGARPRGRGLGARRRARRSAASSAARRSSGDGSRTRTRPVLRTHDRFGHRIDEVEFHPAWHDLMRTSVAHGLHALPWREPRRGAHVARAALFFTLSQVEAGHVCPISMTYSGVPALRAQPELAARVGAAHHLDGLRSRACVPRPRRPARSAAWR